MSNVQPKFDSKKALIIAANDGKIEEVDRLLEREGIDVNVVVDVENNKTTTPLLAAASAGQMDVIGKLINDYQANIEIKDNSERTPLLIAAQYGQADAVKALVECDADLSVTDVDGKTALHFAVLSGDIHTVQALLAAGIDYLAEDKNGQTAFDLAAKKSAEEFVNATKRKAGGHFNQIVAFIGDKMQQQLRELFANGGQKNTDLITENNALKAENADLKQRLQHPEEAEEKWTKIAGEAESPTVFKGEEEKKDDDGEGAMDAVGGSPAFVLKR